MTIATASAAEAPVVPDANVHYCPLEATAGSYEVEGGPLLRVTLERDDDVWIVTDQVTGIHGCGPEASEAVNDFGRALQEHLDVLERQDRLSDDLTRQLTYLRSVVRP
ncbi:MAG TPA: hypothetical protein VFA44_16270 [Gaiellaceae bacterium]|nr:hypothetical protein [Gaiellaceae bacterium]